MDSQKTDMCIVPCSVFPLDCCSAAHRATTETLQREIKGGGTSLQRLKKVENKRGVKTCRWERMERHLKQEKNI